MLGNIASDIFGGLNILAEYNRILFFVKGEKHIFQSRFHLVVGVGSLDIFKHGNKLVEFVLIGT